MRVRTKHRAAGRFSRAGNYETFVRRRRWWEEGGCRASRCEAFPDGPRAMKYGIASDSASPAPPTRGGVRAFSGERGELFSREGRDALPDAGRAPRPRRC